MTNSEQNDVALLNDIRELIDIRVRDGQRYLDDKTDRYYEFATGRIIPKSKIRADDAREQKLRPHIVNSLKCGRAFDVAFSDYFPDMALGRMTDSALWFYEIGSGIRPYARRSASDLTVIEHGDDLVNAMLSVDEIESRIASGDITQRMPLAWYENTAILYAYSKTSPVMDKLARTSIHNAMILFIKAQEGGKPKPSRLELWLAMNPIELFTTDEGRAERERQEMRFRNGATTLS